MNEALISALWAQAEFKPWLFHLLVQPWANSFTFHFLDIKSKIEVG